MLAGCQAQAPGDGRDTFFVSWIRYQAKTQLIQRRVMVIRERDCPAFCRRGIDSQGRRDRSEYPEAGSAQT
jgi:hypothetical protein